MSADRFWRTHDGMDALTRDIQTRVSRPVVRRTDARNILTEPTLPNLPVWTLWVLLTVPALAILFATILIGGTQ